MDMRIRIREKAPVRNYHFRGKIYSIDNREGYSEPRETAQYLLGVRIGDQPVFEANWETTRQQASEEKEPAVSPTHVPPAASPASAFQAPLPHEEPKAPDEEEEEEPEAKPPKREKKAEKKKTGRGRKKKKR